MALILNSAGKPEPSPEIGRRLLAIHPGLHLRFVDMFDSQWAVCMNWQENDRRWRLVQEGVLGAGGSYDIIGYIPQECGLDEAPAYLERMFRQYRGENAEELFQKVHEFNEAPAREAAEQALAEVLDRADPSKAVANTIISVPKAAPKRRRTSKYLD
jgi:hypothetical protein